MAMNLGSIFFKIGADTKGIETAKKETVSLAKEAKKAGEQAAVGFAAADRQAARFAEKARKAGIESKALGEKVKKAGNEAKILGDKGQKAGDKITTSLKKATSQGNLFLKFFAASTLIFAVKMIISAADNYNVLQQRIKSATEATGNFSIVNKRLFAITQETGSQLKTNVALFQAMSRASLELGATSTQMLDLTKAVNQLGVISGSTNDELKFGVRQFTQGLSSNVFRAEEFNSILENLPELANRIAKGLGFSVGELRLAIVSGKVLSKDVFDALITQTATIDEDFKKFDISIARAGQTLFTSLVKANGEFLKATGFIDAMSSGFSKLAKKIDGIDFKKWGARFKNFTSQMAIGLVLTNKTALSQENLNKALAESKRLREEASAAVAPFVGPDLPEDRRVEIAEEAEKELQAVLKRGIDERNRIEATGAFLRTKIFSKEGKESLAVKGKNFRDQIDQAGKYSKEFFALNKAISLATALIEAPSAILSAYSFGVKAGGGPIGGTISATIASAAVGVQLAAINSATFSGARQTGGPVNRNSMSRVNESGPELLTVGNKDFLLTGAQSGTITANNDLRGGSNVMVNVSIINNGAPIDARAQQTKTSEGFDIELILDGADKRVASGIRNGDGETSRALQNVFNLNRASGALN